MIHCGMFWCGVIGQVLNNANHLCETVHVKWERQIERNERNRTRYQFVAFLAEGFPSEGREDVKVLTRLGAIQERFLFTHISRTRAFHMGLFWVKVDRRLEGLNLEKGVKETLEAQIMEKVPRPANDWALWGVTCIPRFDG